MAQQPAERAELKGGRPGRAAAEARRRSPPEWRRRCRRDGSGRGRRRSDEAKQQRSGGAPVAWEDAEAADGHESGQG